MLCIISCGSTPPSSEPQEESPLEESRQALTAAQERVKNLRKLAEDFDGPQYVPDEWNRAESQYTQLKTLKPDSAQAYQEAIEKYTTLGDTYDELGLKALSRYRENRNQMVQSAREEAVAAGAAELLPELLDTADTQAAEALKRYDAADYYAFARESAAAEEGYGLLKGEALAEEQRQRARALREEALNLKAPIAMPEAYQEADLVYTEGERTMSAKDFKQALAMFTQSADQFVVVRDETAKKRQTADKAIQTAQDKILDSDKQAKSAQAKQGGVR